MDNVVGLQMWLIHEKVLKVDQSFGDGKTWEASRRELHINN